jgi:hypothetical protein
MINFLSQILFKSRKGSKLKVFLKLLCACLLVGSSTIVQAQSAVSVDPVTGAVQSAIPLHTISSGDLSVPIALEYIRGNGLKVNDSEALAGLCWTLSTSGAVVRQVNGLPDDYVGSRSGSTSDTRTGWLHGANARSVRSFVPAADNNLATCADEASDFTKLNSFGYTNDTEPDIFIVNAPGLSVRFLFDHNKLIQTLPYEDLKIAVSRRDTDSLITKIDITNNHGVKYEFSAGDFVSRYAYETNFVTPQYFTSDFNLFNRGTKFYNSWYLTKITSPRGGVINFTYEDPVEMEASIPIEVVNNTTAKIDTVYFIRDIVSGKRLKSIDGANETSTFQWQDSRLSSVVILDKAYQETKKIVLQYKYISPIGVGSLRTSKAFLHKVYQEVNCQQYPAYEFEYYSIDYALKKTPLQFHKPEHQDLFGFYNGVATSAVPEVYISNGDVATDGERFRIYPASNYSLIATGGNRAVDTAKVYYGALRSVKLPSGGSIAIKYEASEYLDQVTNTNRYGAGIRAKRLLVNDHGAGKDEITIYRYRQSRTSGLSSGRWTYRPMFAFANGTHVVRTPKNLAPEEVILYSRVEVSTYGKGTVVHEFRNFGMYPSTSAANYSASLSKVARLYNASQPCISPGNLKTGYFSYPFAKNTNYTHEQGMPSRISYFNANGKVVRRVIYTPESTTLPKIEIGGIRFEKLANNTFIYSKYLLNTNINSRIAAKSTRNYDEADTTKFTETIETYTYNLIHQLLSRATISQSDGVSTSAEFIYAKDYPTTGTDHQSTMINTLVANNQHSTIVELIEKKGSEVIDAELTLFNNYNGRILPSQKLGLITPAGFSQSSIVSGSFTYATTKYKPMAYYDEYSSRGFAQTVRDVSRKPKSVIYGYNESLPVAEIENATISQVVFADFESGLGLNYSGSLPTLVTDSWAGKNAVSLTSGSALYKENIVKGRSRYYRLTCWIKAPASLNFTLSPNTGTAWSAQTFPVNIPSDRIGKWHFVELRVDLNNVAHQALFSWKLTPSGAVLIDQLTFYPETAVIQSATFRPLYGITAKGNERGIAQLIDYDALGRPYFTKDGNHNILQITEYGYTNSHSKVPLSAFSFSPKNITLKPAVYDDSNGYTSEGCFPSPTCCNIDSPPALPTGIYTGTNVTFTPIEDCIPGVQYQWYVDGVLQTTTGSTLQHVFNENRDYNVKLISLSTNGSSETESIIHPRPKISVSATMAAGEKPYFDCRDSYVRNMTANVTGSFDPAKVRYNWYYQLPGATSKTCLGATTTNQFQFTIPVNQNFQLICEVIAFSKNQNTGVKERVIAYDITNFTWRVVSPC